jgi:hypothetical protein
VRAVAGSGIDSELREAATRVEQMAGPAFAAHTRWLHSGAATDAKILDDWDAALAGLRVALRSEPPDRDAVLAVLGLEQVGWLQDADTDDPAPVKLEDGHAFYAGDVGVCVPIFRVSVGP